MSTYNSIRLNRRRKQSITLIKDAFVDMMQEMKFEQITVTELCKRADINRATFYSNFEDIYALVTSIENDIYESVGKLFEQYDNMDELEFYKEMFRTYDRVKAYSIIHLLPRHCDEKLNSIMYKNVVKKRVNNNSLKDSKLLELSYQYSRAGTVAITNEWLKSKDRISPDRIAEYVYKLNTACIGLSDPGGKFYKPATIDGF